MEHRVTKALLASLARWRRAAVPSPCLVCAAPMDAPFLCRRCRACSAIDAPLHQHRIGLRIGTLTVLARGLYWTASGSAPSPAAQLLHRFKYAHERAAGRALAHLLAERTSQALGGLRAAMVPIPLHRRRLRSRGFNQAAWLARELAKQGAGVVAPDTLVRPRDDAPSPGRTADERRRPPPGRPRVLVDDVCTTGSTLAAAADALAVRGSVVHSAIVLLLADRERGDDTARSNGEPR
jgi:predicted amidophosphoribosyltransferase